MQLRVNTSFTRRARRSRGAQVTDPPVRIFVQFNGANGVILKSRGIRKVVRHDTGSYTITLAYWFRAWCAVCYVWARLRGQKDAGVVATITALPDTRWPGGIPE